jgi:CheY-like chemotaxis protein
MPKPRIALETKAMNRIQDTVKDDFQQGQTAIREPAAASGTLRFLVADDDTILKRALSDMIVQLGHVVAASACDGQEAVEAFVRNPQGIDAVLMDVNMPRKNGVSAAGDIRALAPSVKIVLMSGDPRNSGFAADLDRVGFIMKPFMPEAMLEQLGCAPNGPQQHGASRQLEGVS